MATPIEQARKSAKEQYSNFTGQKQGATSVFGRLHREIGTYKKNIELSNSGGILLAEPDAKEKNAALSCLLLEREKLRRIMRAVEETESETLAFNLVSIMQRKTKELGSAGADYFYSLPAAASVYSLMLSDKVDFRMLSTLSDFCADVLPLGQHLSAEATDHARRVIFLSGAPVGTYSIHTVAIPSDSVGKYNFVDSLIPLDYKYGEEYSTFTALEFSVLFDGKKMRMGNSKSGEQSPLNLVKRMFSDAGMDFSKLESEINSITEPEGQFFIKPSFYAFSMYSVGGKTNALVPDVTFTYRLPTRSGPAEYVFQLSGKSFSVVHPDGSKMEGLEGDYSL